MPQVAVQKIHSNEIESCAPMKDVNALYDQIRQRAYELFENRACGDGRALNETTEGNVQFCEFDEKNLFRQFDLPAPIDVDKVTANVDKGILIR